MSIRLLARDLYRLQLEVDKLETALANARMDQHESLRAQLRTVRTERDRLRRFLDGQKDSPAKPRH